MPMSGAATRALSAIRNRYGAESAARKLALLRSLDGSSSRSPRALLKCHDDLLFLTAFGDDRAVRDAALQALTRTATRVRALSLPARRLLDDTGLAGTRSHHAFELPIVRYLLAHHPGAVDIDWAAMAASSAVDLLLSFIARRADQDGLDSDKLSTRAWRSFVLPSRYS